MVDRKWCFSLMLVLTTSLFITGASALDGGTLIAYWPLDRDTRDATGNGSDGEIMGDPQWVDGRFGDALLFDGQDDYVNVPDDSDQNKILDLKEAITLMAWVEVATITANNPNFCAKDHAYFLGYHSGTQSLRHGVHTDAWNVKEASQTIDLETWMHVCLTYDGNDMLYYKNGELTDEFSVSSDLNKEDSNFVIGTFQKVEDKGLSQIFNGKVDEVAIFDGALSGDEIKLVMNMGIKKGLAVDSWGKLTTTWGEIKVAR